MALIWRDSMSFGNAPIDSDHKKILTLVNATEKYTVDWNPALLSEILERVRGFAESHFAEEEALMLSVGYPAYEEHVALHRDTLKKALYIYQNFKNTKGDEQQKQWSSVLLKFMTDYFVNHLIKEDLKLKPYLKKTVGDNEAWPVFITDKQIMERNNQGSDIEYVLPPELSDLIKRIDYIIPKMPPPQSDFSDFYLLYEAAIWYRIEKILVFFQRHNPAVVRELPPIFICSPEFAEKFHQAVKELIFPAIRNSRQVQMLSTSFAWSKLDSASFWNHLSTVLRDAILSSWAAAWDSLKLIGTTREDGNKAWQIGNRTKLLRDMLQPSEADAYDLPRVCNREIETFKSLLDTNTDWWEKLNHSWKICHDIYEQEKDPRVFQQKAREGAMRDNLIAAFENLPERWGDFVVLACHRVFPRISTVFLDSFITNFGRSDQTREAYLPYTVYYLKQARQRPEIRLRELREEAEWQSKTAQLRDYLSGRKATSTANRRKDGHNGADTRRTILVVDDIDYMRKQMSHILRAAGMPNVVEADEGGKAFELLLAAPEMFELVISDLDMNPTSGLHLLKILRTDRELPEAIRNIPFIMLTGDASAQSIVEIRNAGANGVVTKPFTATSLVTKTLKVLGVAAPP